MSIGAEGDSGGWVPYAFAGLQTVIATVLAYISKLLRDIRGEITSVKMEVNRHDVQIEEQDKRLDLRVKDVDRRLDRLEDKNK